jgi:hypothetical protein
MAKASLTLENGTVVAIEGTVDEVRDLLRYYNADTDIAHRPAQHAAKARSKAPAPRASADAARDAMPDLSEIVNLVKNCDEAEAIERHILDRTSQVDMT